MSTMIEVDPRARAVTRRNFERLPFLIKLSEFCFWTGLHKDRVRALTRRGVVREFKPSGCKYAKYYKEDVAVLLGWREKGGEITTRP